MTMQIVLEVKHGAEYGPAVEAAQALIKKHPELFHVARVQTDKVIYPIRGRHGD